jgi:hypothetical protein
MSDELPDLSRAHDIDADEVARFRRDGCVVLRGVALEREIVPYRPLIHASWGRNKLDARPLAERDTYGRAFTQALNLGLRDARVFRFAYARRFAKIAADLMGVSGVRMFLDEAFFKEPGSGPTPWHQDQSTWPFDAERGVTLWIPLMNVTADLGLLTFAGGSHHAKQLVGADISDESDAALERVVVERGYPRLSFGAMTIGDVTAHDGWMVHRADRNQTNEIREVYAMHYFADGARVVQPDNPARARILEHFAPGLRPGDLAASDRWRRVYPDLDPLEMLI